jgi:putative SOS response-associated peptidase YedK
MCGRYSILTEDEIIEIRGILRDWALKIVRDDFEDYDKNPGEIFPTDHAPVITMQDDGVSFENLRWGFKKWDGKGVIINARVETLKTKSIFRPHLIAGRCVVPAGEYFEWERVGKKKKKHFVKDKEGNLLFMAGLYRETKNGREFVIITKDACGDVEKIHDRMPVILRTDQIESWLNGELDPDVMVGLDFNMSVAPVDNGDEQLRLEE